MVKIKILSRSLGKSCRSTARRCRLDIPECRGAVDVKTAYVPGIDSFAIKISPGFCDNPKIGLPSTNGMMVPLSSKTGFVQALLLN